jgi:cytidylate kinase
LGNVPGGEDPLHRRPNVTNIIAIDGPAASGKSTLAQRIANSLGYLYFDTGVMYRAVTLAALQDGLEIENEKVITELARTVEIDVLPPTVEDGRVYTVLLNGEDVTWQLRSIEVDANVSQVSIYQGVREAMTQRQREIGSRGKVVMVGRDIGTVVLPEADLKIYLDASVEERAKRRFEESISQGDSISYDQVIDSMQERDQLDSTRVHAPMKAAEDAVFIDTTKMTIDEVERMVSELVIGSADNT